MTALLQAPETHAELPMHPIQPLEPTHEQIARRAYALHLAHGCPDGCDVEDWLAAEAELREELAAGEDLPPAG